MFLVTVGHNAKNKTCQLLFHRSIETVSQTIRSVLLTVLNLHHVLLAKLVPVWSFNWSVYIFNY
ncbi:hypothetical protein LINPERPRIM_LOCUS30317 [Linum perenne]